MDTGQYYLKDNEGMLAGLRNMLPGNYVIPDQGDPTTNFLKVFALRALPHLRNRFLRADGKFTKRGFRCDGTGVEMVRLRDGIDAFLGKDFSGRRKFIVNLDANPTQVMVSNDGRRTYTDWDHTYFGLLEEQLAEILLGSSIRDEDVKQKLVDDAFTHAREYVGGTLEDWRRIVDNKLIEKLLARSARYVDVARKVENPAEQRLLSGLANEAYTLALRKLDELNVDRADCDTRERIRDFGHRHLGLEELAKVEDRAVELSGNIGSVVSTVNDRVSLEGMKSNFRISPSDPQKWARIRKRLGIAALATPALIGVTAMALYMGRINKIEEMKAAAMYNGKEIVVVDPHYQQVRFPLNDGKDPIMAPPNLQTEEDYIRWAYEVQPGKDGDAMVHGIKQLVLPFAREVKRLKSYSLDKDSFIAGNVLEKKAESAHVDPDLIRAIIGSAEGAGLPVTPPEYIPPMCIKPSNDFYRTYLMDHTVTLHDSATNVEAGARFLYQCVRHNEGKLADTLAEYFNGVYEVQRAMIDSGSQDYSVYRTHLNNLWALQRTDQAIANFLALKGRIAPEEGK